MPRASLDMQPGLFYDLELGYFLPTEAVPAGANLHIGDSLPAGGCMFTINAVLLNGRRCGYVFYSKFETRNEGGFLVTYLQSGRGKATEAEVIVKHEHLLLYHFPNRGSLAISPSVNPEVLRVFEEQ